jgi:hypothetical protein
MATPFSVVPAAVALLNEQASAPDAPPGQEWPASGLDGGD